MSIIKYILNSLLIFIFSVTIIIYASLNQQITPGPITNHQTIQYQNYLQQSDSLDHMSFISAFSLNQPYDFDLDHNNNYYLGTKGRIMRIQKLYLKNIFNTSGKIFGIKFLNDQEKKLIYIDQKLGLCQLNIQTKKMDILTNKFEGKQFLYLSGLDISQNGKIYFTETSSKYKYQNQHLQFLQGNPFSSVYSYDILTKKTQLILKNLHHATGIYVSPDQSYLLISQTFQFRVLKYILKGQNKGQLYPIIQQLPGFPLNLKGNDNNQIWISMPYFRTNLLIQLTKTMAKHNKLRNLVKKIPRQWFKFLFFKSTYTGAIKLNGTDGKIIKIIRSRARSTQLNTLIEKDRVLYFIDQNQNAFGQLKCKYLKESPIQ